MDLATFDAKLQEISGVYYPRPRNGFTFEDLRKDMFRYLNQQHFGRVMDGTQGLTYFQVATEMTWEFLDVVYLNLPSFSSDQIFDPTGNAPKIFWNNYKGLIGRMAMVLVVGLHGHVSSKLVPKTIRSIKDKFLRDNIATPYLEYLEDKFNVANGIRVNDVYYLNIDRWEGAMRSSVDNKGVWDFHFTLNTVPVKKLHKCALHGVYLQLVEMLAKISSNFAKHVNRSWQEWDRYVSGVVFDEKLLKQWDQRAFHNVNAGFISWNPDHQSDEGTGGSSDESTDTD